MKKYRVETGNEIETLYTGIDALDGEWLLTTPGDPTCLVECEDSGDEDTINLVAEIVRNESPAEADESDVEYVSSWLRIWGLQ